MTTVQSVGPNIQQPMQMKQSAIQPQYYPEILDVQEFPDHYVYTVKEEASTGKKWGVGLASLFCPGLGQGINGQWGKAAGMFGGYIAASLLPLTKNSSATIIGCLGALGIGIWSIVDAVKNASSKTKQILPKENINIQG